MSAPHKNESRQIRVFVSSTFRDMQEERDELVLQIFPQLRRLCEERGVTWGEVDLRWGITEEQAEHGKVLPICLEEIKRCRPYFIGLLGERYGWVPDLIPKDVIDSNSWLQKYIDSDEKKSVTELEILHGVLNDPEMADHAFFYFRDPKFVDSVDEDKKNIFLSENAESETKLQQLKDRIHQEYNVGNLLYEPRENYENATDLGAQILEDFTALIDTLYPEGEKPSPLERERMDHETFARSRSSVYIGRQEYFDELDAHVASDNPPLVVLGESGSGKSALLSNWAIRYHEQHPEDFLLLHFIGGSPDSTDATRMLRRIMLELKEKFNLSDDVPTKPEQIREQFPDWLTKTAGQGRIILVLDALNQLEDIDNAPDLGWLPRVFPKHCRVILSTLPGRSLKAVTSRGWLERTSALEVKPLNVKEKRKLIHDYLAQFSHDLGSERTKKLEEAGQTSNPLYLRVLLDELRVFGIHEKLNERIDWYLEANNPYELYKKVIIRWEDAYEGDTDLVGDALSLLWSARRGLSETELLEALGKVDRPFARALFSPLYLAMSDSLINRSGLLTFAHDFLRQAVEESYIPSTLHRQNFHKRLVEYFQRQKGWSERKLDELPWQLSNALEWQQLHDVLTEEACFLGLYERNEYELLGYWLLLEPQFDMGKSYTAVFKHWEQLGKSDSDLSFVANHLGLFLFTSARYSAAEPLMKRALSIDETIFGSDHPDVAINLINLAAFFETMDRFEEAESHLRRALSINEVSFGKDHLNVAINLSNLAQILQDTNRLKEAEPLMIRVITIFEKLNGPNHPNTAIAFNNLAELFRSTNHLAEAELLYSQALSIDEAFYGPDHPDVAIDLSNLGELFRMTNRLVEAELLIKRALSIDEASYGPDHPKIAIRLNNLAQLLQATSRFEEAEPLMRHALEIDEASFGSEHSNVAIRLNNLARLLQDTNRLEEAEPLMRRALAIDESSYGLNHPSVATSLNNLALLLQDSDNLEDAESLYCRALAIDEDFFGPDHPKVAIRLNNLATLYLAANRLVKAEHMMLRALKINETFLGKDHPDVAFDLNNLATLFRSTNRLKEAKILMERVIKIFVLFRNDKGHEHPYYKDSLNNFGSLLTNMGLREKLILKKMKKLGVDINSI
jgi:tetratricopeptide (TPR) repeat protein